MRIVIETERLILRQLVPEDAEAAFCWCGDPEVNTYMVYPLYHSAEDVRKWLQSRDPDAPDNYDFGFVLKENGMLIGSGGLSLKYPDDTWEIGYNLRKDQWGHGYAVEAIQGILAELQKRRRVSAIEGCFAAENSKSRRVMEKLGMHFLCDTEYTKLDGSRTFPAKVYRKELLNDKE